MVKKGLVVSILLFLYSLSSYSVIYVNKASTDPNPDGTSWAKAFRTIQEGIDAAAAQAGPGNPVEVWVAQGNYDELRTEPWGAPASVEGSLVMRSYVHLYGGFKGTETSRDQRRPAKYITTIDGRTSRWGTNAYHVIVIGRANEPNYDVVIDGFHIRGGRATGVAGDYHTWRGAGIYNWLSSPRIGNCVFYDNVAATAGGAIANMSGTIGSNNYKANALIHDCIFRGNTCNEAVDTGVSPIRGGAGIFNNGINSANAEIGNETKIINCTFYNNTSANLSGPMLYNANTIMNSGCGVSFPKIYNNIIWNPTAPANPHIRAFRPGIGFVYSEDVQYCDVQGGYGGGGVGNLNVDPQFRNPGNNDLRLNILSPCVNAGSNALVDPPLGPGRLDIRSYYRLEGGTVDMGAYENVYFSGNMPVDFVGTPTEILAGQSVQFEDLSETYGLWPETTWSWNFGDSGTSNQQNPSYQYNTAGRYTVSLTVTTAEGNGSMTKTDYIVVHTPPVAQFSANPVQGQYPLTVQFTDESIADQLPGNTTQITDWYWDFDGDSNWDAHYTTATNPQWTYNTVGVYTVTLRVISQYGEDTETKTNYIDVWPDPLSVSNISIQEFDPPRDSPFNEDDFSSPTATNLTDGYIGFGRSFRMTVNASGGYGPPYQYQWQIFKGGSWINVTDGSFVRFVNGSDGVNNTQVTTVISGATTNQLTVEYAIPGQEDGQYRCVVTDPNDTPPPPNQVISNTRTITINTNMMRTVVDLQAQVKKYIGENVIYSFKFIGGPGTNYLYQWYVDKGSGLEGVGTGGNPTTIFNLDQTMRGNYYGTAINITGGGQTVFCGPSYLDVQPIVSVSAQPQSIHRNTGGTAQFTATFAGGYPPYTFQWFWNGTPLVDGPHPSGSGATVAITSNAGTTTLTITNLGLADAGNYKASATDTENRGAPSTEDTNEAVLSVTNPFVITDPTPNVFALYVDSIYTVSVTASGGTPPYTFVWQRNTGSGYETLTDGGLGGRVSIVSDASSSVLRLVNTEVADSGQYRCIAIDSGPDPDAYPANPGILNVYAYLSVSNQYPLDVIENVGNQAQFTVQTTGGWPPLSYGWQYATDPAGPWTTLTNGPHPLHASSTVSGADGPTLVIQIAEGAHLSALQNSYYRCIVSDNGMPQSGTSRVAKLSITNFINVQGPADVRAYTGESPVQLVVNVSGGQPPFFYEWFKGTQRILGPVEGQNILDLGTADASDAGDYYVVVSDSSGGLNPDVTSRVANVKVADPPQIVTHPQSLNLYAGQDAVFQVEVVGGFEPYNYDWWRIGVGSLGVNSAQLVILDVDESYDGAQFFVYVSDQPSTVSGLNTVLTSDPALLRVASSEVVFTKQPEDERVYVDDPAFVMSAEFVGGLPPVTYEWKRELPGGGVETVAVNTLAITVNTSELSVGIYRYYLEVTDDIPMVYQSRKAIVEVNEHLQITRDLESEYYTRDGDRLIMYVEVGGGLGDKVYTWYRNVGNKKAWEVIPGAIGPVLVIDPVEMSDAGQYYVVIQDSGSTITGDNDTVQSSVANVYVEKGVPASREVGLVVLVMVSVGIGVVAIVRRKKATEH